MLDFRGFGGLRPWFSLVFADRATPPERHEGEWRLLEPGAMKISRYFPWLASSVYDHPRGSTLEDVLSNGK